MKLIKPLLCAASLSFASLTFAGGVEVPSPSSFYMTLFGGSNWETSGELTAVDLAGGGLLVNQYNPNSDNSRAGPIAGLDLGYRWVNQRDTFFLGLGVETSWTTVTSPYGIVNPAINLAPDIDTLSYNYEVQSVPLFGMLQLGGRMGLVELYAIGGLGVSWNQGYNYNEVATNPGGASAPGAAMYQQHTQTEFAYTAGAGIDFVATTSTRVGLEYRYTNYGTAALTPTPIQDTSNKLNLGDIISNALLLHLTVLFSQ